MDTRTERMALIVLLVSACGARAARSQGEWDVPKDPSKFHIFACLGQSNMAGGFKESHLYNDEGRYDPVTDPVPRVLVFKSGGWKPAAHPLIKHNKVSFSLPIPFARKYLELLGDPEVKVGLVRSGSSPAPTAASRSASSSRATRCIPDDWPG
jgi:hypothetical protein